MSAFAARRVLAATAASSLLATGLVVTAQQAQAFKPYTHAQTGIDARTDAIDDGYVEILGGKYEVPGAVRTALEAQPASYNAGVIGPDGFPDLVMGQSVIHPENTGLWLRHILSKAWEAQTDPAYADPVERQKILAFAYGYLTHASGDLWMHTMINEFAEGTFPGVGEMLDEPAKAAIAVRHLVAEGYVGDATRDFDGNPDRTEVPVPTGGTTYSDDSTPHIPFDAPLGWIQDTLVDRVDAQGAPVGPAQDRGFLLDFFHEKRAALQADLDSDPQPLEAALARYNGLKERFDALFRDPPSATSLDSGACSFGHGNDAPTAVADVAHDLVACPVEGALLGIDAAVKTLDAAFTAATQTVALALDTVADAYRAAWIADIDAGLEAWPQVGLGLTRALFDPATRRALQDEECQYLGTDATTDVESARAECEAGVGAVDVVFDELDPFLNQHLLSMVGLPDGVGGLREALQGVADSFDSVMGPALNPIRLANHELHQFAEDLIEDELNRRYGIDVDQIQDYLGSPSSKMDVGSISLDLPFVGHVEPQLFRTAEDRTEAQPETDHEKLDRYLGISGDHHHGAGGGLGDDVVFDEQDYAAYANTVTLNKMLLLDGAELDRLMSDITGGTYSFYGKDGERRNVMTTPLPDVAGVDETGPAGQQWLKLIDGDHAWRSNSQPVFGDVPSAGHGNFPLWESCVLRPAFRTLFTDWENDGDRDGVERGTTDGDGDGWLDPGENFPEHGDAPTVDPQDASVPTAEIDVTGNAHTAGGTTYVAKDAVLTVDAADGYWPDDRIGVQVEVTGPGGALPALSGLRHDGDTVDLSSQPDGTYAITTTPRDACAAGQPVTTQVVVDNTAPVLTLTSPTAAQYDTDDVPPFTWTAVDAGSGVQSETGTFDSAASTNGARLDMFTLQPGLHTVALGAVDNLGNGSSTSHVFRLRATATSLLTNLDRARAEGKVSSASVYTGLRDSLLAAQKSHAKDQHSVEWNQLGAFVNKLLAQRGKGVETATADRFLAYARDVISGKG